MKTRKKNICISVILAMLLLLSACANGNETPSEPAQSDSEQPAVTPPEPADAPPAKGTVKTFQYNDFSLEVSNVKEIKQGSCFDGMETCVYDVYIVYPGAMAKVLKPIHLLMRKPIFPMQIGLFQLQMMNESTLWMTWSRWRLPEICWGFTIRSRASMCLDLKWMTGIVKEIRAGYIT